MKIIKYCIELLFSGLLILSGGRDLLTGHAFYRGVSLDGLHVRIVGVFFLCLGFVIIISRLKEIRKNK
jgi:hypothetical protein